MATLEDEIAVIQRSLNPQLQIRGYFLSMVGSRSKTQQTCRELLTQALGEGMVFKATIPLMASFDTAINLRRPIVYHSQRSKASQVFRDFALEVISVYPATSAHKAAA